MKRAKLPKLLPYSALSKIDTWHHTNFTSLLRFGPLGTYPKRDNKVRVHLTGCSSLEYVKAERYSLLFQFQFPDDDSSLGPIYEYQSD
jgi:hypothetical protein